MTTTQSGCQSPTARLCTAPSSTPSRARQRTGLRSASPLHLRWGGGGGVRVEGSWGTGSLGPGTSRRRVPPGGRPPGRGPRALVQRPPGARGQRRVRGPVARAGAGAEARGPGVRGRGGGAVGGGQGRAHGGRGRGTSGTGFSSATGVPRAPARGARDWGGVEDQAGGGGRRGPGPGWGVRWGDGAGARPRRTRAGGWAASG